MARSPSPSTFEIASAAISWTNAAVFSPDVAIEHLFPPYTAEKVEALEQGFQN